jgi:hypothetical protein
MARRLQDFFGDDFEDTFDSIKSVPGAFGNLVFAAVRQVKPLDLVAFSLVLAGWCWIIGGHYIAGQQVGALLLLSLLPTALWFVAGVTGGFIFHIGAIGKRSLAYWESYLLILLFGVFGVVSLRLALDPRDRRVYRATPSGPEL